MPSYTTIFSLALAVSSVSPVLSVPIPQVREQSMGRSGLGPETSAPLGKRAEWGKLLKKVAIGLGIGTAATVTGVTAINAITGPPSTSEPPPTTTGTVPAAPPHSHHSSSPPPNSSPQYQTNSGTPPSLADPNGYSIFDRSVSNENKRAPSTSELFTDLALKPFKRALDELD